MGAGVIEIPEREKFNGFGDRRWRWEGGVALGMRRLMRVRRVCSDEEGRVERDHERPREREEPHLKDPKGHRIETVISAIEV